MSQAYARILVSITVLLGTLWPACVVAQEQAGQKGASIRVGYMKIANLIDVMVAQDMGFFKKHGLNPQTVQFRSGAEGMAALQGGAVDITMGLPSFAMIANEQGFDLVAVLQHEIVHSQPPDSGAIMVKKDSGIKGLADLRGKTIGVNTLRAQDVVSARYVMRKLGVPLETVKFVEVPYYTHADVLQKGQVDAVMTVDPFTTRIRQLQIGIPISWMFVEAIPAQPIGVFWAKRKWSEENGKIVESFNAAMIDAIEYLNKNPERARDLIAKYIGLDRGLLGAMPMILWDYKVQPSKWEAVIRAMRDQGELKRDHQPGEYFSDQIKQFIAR